MRIFREGEEAVSSVIGVTLMVGQTVIMVAIIAASLFAFSLPGKAPGANIVVREAGGGMDLGLYENHIVLAHKGGDMLDRNRTGIIITGRGYAYDSGSYPALPARDIRITYMDLSGNNYGGIYGNNLGPIVKGTTWDAGEIITLYGSDGKNLHSTITTQGNRVDSKWKLETGSLVSVMVIDIPTDQVIAMSEASVK